MAAQVTTTIAARGLSVTYGPVRALADVTLEVDALAIGLLGANGAGKSTLMKVLLGLVRPDTGSVEVLGVDAIARATEVRRRVGYMPEHDCLPTAMTARDLVVHLAELRGLPRRQAVLRASETLFQVGLEEERSRLIGTFSTGMKQRAKLAQALVHAPELVVLDEPTNGLDPAGREEMLQLVRRLSTELGIRVLLSSHVLEDVERTCDAVVLLRDGRLVSAGRIDALRGRSRGRLRVRVSGDQEAFRARLTAAGVDAEDGDDGLVVVGEDDAVLLAIRDAAEESGVGLRELRPIGATLEDALIGAME
jgi:ABC-2 type transport system ATP-binding protein